MSHGSGFFRSRLLPVRGTKIVRITTGQLSASGRWSFRPGNYVEMGGRVVRIVAQGDDWLDVEVEDPPDPGDTRRHAE